MAVFFLVSLVAGILTVLAPCILPLLPIVIGSADTKDQKKLSLRSIRIIASLAVSVIIFTLLLKASTLLVDIPNSFWTWFSGIVIVLLGLAMIFPETWSRLRIVNLVNRIGNRIISIGHGKKSNIGDYIVGLSLGPVFSTCSPTYLFIIATVIPASLSVGMVYLLGFTLGLVISLLLVAYFGQVIVSRIVTNQRKAEITKKIFGILVLVVGLLIITGLDKRFESWVLDSGYRATIDFEESLINEFGDGKEEAKDSIDIPNRLERTFPETNWNKVDDSIEKALSGGPGKDGIPSIDNPKFVPISEFSRDMKTQAIVLESDGFVKAYPYNILTWHEIVNDEIGSQKISVTFCPLCGSAVVYDRELGYGETTLGVSGFLIESNMVMYDRSTQSLWQQSTGESIAGDYLGEKLDLVKFQLMTIGEVIDKYPNASVLSEDTGYFRNYGLDPYSGYNENEKFIFAPSRVDKTYDVKEIMVVFNYKNTSFSFPINDLKEGQKYSHKEINISKNDGVIKIIDKNGEDLPFYFEMWFSWAVQNEEGGEVIELE